MSDIEATGNPILDAGSAVESEPASSVSLENNKPSHSSPLKSSVTAADLDPTSQAVPTSGAWTASDGETAASSGSQQQSQGTVEGVLSGITGAAVAAPAAVFEAVSQRAPAVPNALKPSDQTVQSVTNSLPSTQAVQEQAQTILSSASATASNLASQATSLAQQAVQSLPASVSSYLPAGMTGGSPATPTHQAAMPVTSETRETTSAPIVDSRTDRPVATHKALVPEPSSADTPSTSGMSDITQTHTTGNFEAGGSLQLTHNPELVEAQTDLAVKAENGDL